MSTTETTDMGKLSMKRARAVIRSWDGPNSRLGCEVDAKDIPWPPFEGLGREVTLLLPTLPAREFDADTGEPQTDRALRYVEHAIARCQEFANQNGSDPSWRSSQETWEWIRDRLTTLWANEQAGEEKAGAARTPETPVEARLAGLSMPGAARTLEVAALALRTMHLGAWRDAVATLDPDMPTREETVQTLKGVARLLTHGTPHGEGKPGEPPPPPSQGAAPAPMSVEEHADDELSIDYARGYDEGYQMGRKVGRALAAHDRMKVGRGGSGGGF